MTSIFSEKTPETTHSMQQSTLSIKLQARPHDHPVPTRELPSYSVSFLGSAGVGKTSLILRAKTNRFQDNLEPSIGINYNFFYFK